MEKTPTQQAIEDAIAGGWEKSRALYHDWQDPERGQHSMEKMVLDPRFWEAVGKTRGWDEGKTTDMSYAGSQYMWFWQHRMHCFIDHLINGKTIDEALAAISQGV